MSKSVFKKNCSAPSMMMTPSKNATAIFYSLGVSENLQNNKENSFIVETGKFNIGGGHFHYLAFTFQKRRWQLDESTFAAPSTRQAPATHPIIHQYSFSAPKYLQPPTKEKND